MADNLQKTVIGQFSGKCCDSNVTNNNDMKLPRSLFENLFASEEYKRALENGHYIGFLGHPDDPGCMDYKDACIVMTECHIEDNGEVVGTFDLIDTPVGQVVKSFIDAGVNFGISIRGVGDVGYDGEVDPESFVFRGFDLVTFPAYNDCIPEFKQIAASSDLEKQSKYKKVCATVKKNLKAITSSTTLTELREQFNPECDEYCMITEQLDSLACPDCEEVIPEDSEKELLEMKVKSMTTLYLAERQKVQELQNQLADMLVEMNTSEIECSRKLKSYKRIVASQIDRMNDDLNRLERSNKRAEKRLSVMAASQSRIEKENSDNLNYIHKLEASLKMSDDKDEVIASLQADLDKTLSESAGLKKKASNLDDKVAELSDSLEDANSKIDSANCEAAEAKKEAIKASSELAKANEIIEGYQNEFASLYASAIGASRIHLDVTASTTVAEMKKAIVASTSLAANPAFTSLSEGEETFSEIDNEEEFLNSDIVSV